MVYTIIHIIYIFFNLSFPLVEPALADDTKTLIRLTSFLRGTNVRKEGFYTGELRIEGVGRNASRLAAHSVRIPK